MSSTLNKQTNVQVLSNHNVDALHDYLAFFLLTMPFQTRKAVDFMYWCIVLYVFKFGHFYLSEGRTLVIQIANYINKSRYSNSKSAPTTPIIPDGLFSMTLPISLTPEMSHVELAKLFSKYYDKRVVWVYDNNTLISGSPFDSYGTALKAIGLPTSSPVIRRYIDTNKMYKNRYTFTSNKSTL